MYQIYTDMRYPYMIAAQIMEKRLNDFFLLEF
jgi:hypothetical protein